MTVLEMVEAIKSAIADGNSARLDEVITQASQEQCDEIVAHDDFDILEKISDNIKQEKDVQKNFEIFKKLLRAVSETTKHDMISHDDYKIFRSSVWAQSYECAKFLTENVSPDSLEDMVNSKNGEAIVTAAAYGEDEILELILSHTSVPNLNIAIQFNEYNALIQSAHNYGATKLFLDTLRNAGNLSDAINSSCGVQAMSYAAQSGENEVVKLYIEIAKELDSAVTVQLDFLDTNLGRMLTFDNCRAFRYGAQNNRADVLETIFSEVEPQIARAWISTNWWDGGYHSAAERNSSEAVNVMISQFLKPEEDHQSLEMLNFKRAMPKKSQIFLGVVSEDVSKYFNSSMLLEYVEEIEALTRLRDSIVSLLQSNQGEKLATAKANKVIQELLEGDNLKKVKTAAEYINMKRPVLGNDIAREVFHMSYGSYPEKDSSESKVHKEIFADLSERDLSPVLNACLDFFGRKSAEKILENRKPEATRLVDIFDKNLAGRG